MGRLRDITAGPDGTIYIVTNVNPYRIIKIRSTTTAPVYITNYRVNCDQNKLVVEWTTQSEVNNRQFIIYRSSDGQNFTLVSTIASSAPGGNSSTRINYNFTDVVAGTLPVFYKLVSEDKDGRKTNWGIVEAACNNSNGIHFSLLPNPAHTQSTLNIVGSARPLTITVNNNIGQAIYQSKNNGTVSLPVQQWNKGIYYVTVTDDQREVLYRQKLIVQW